MKVRELLPVIKDHFCICRYVGRKGYNFEPVEFYAALNIMYSDYCKVAKKMNVNTVDFFASMAEAFLDDRDAVKDKLAAYYANVVN